jgi:hypothetical protein
MLSHTPDFVDEESAWRPLSREEFRQLGAKIAWGDRGGREWTVRGAGYVHPEAVEYRAVLVSGAQVLIERERFHDGYRLLPGDRFLGPDSSFRQTVSWANGWKPR